MVRVHDATGCLPCPALPTCLNDCTALASSKRRHVSLNCSTFITCPSDTGAFRCVVPSPAGAQAHVQYIRPRCLVNTLQLRVL